MPKSSPVKKTIALIAHDGKKSDITTFAVEHLDILAKCDLVATGTTAKCIEERTRLQVRRYRSGPLGGDVEIAAEVLAGKIDVVFFFVNPLDPHPHDPDIYALIRACNIINVPIATNCATAELIMLKYRFELSLSELELSTSEVVRS